MTTDAGSGLPVVTDLPHPAIDVLTERRAIVVTNRPVLGVSSWLADALAVVPASGRIVTLVTGVEARLTLPLRTLVTAAALQWIVQTPDGRFYDGTDGTPQRFDDVEFHAEPGAVAPEFAVRPSDADPEVAGWQVLVSMTIEHRADVHTELGRAVETITAALTGEPLTGWGVHEPVSEPWRREDLTAAARRRMPEDTRFTVTGPGSIASVVARRTARGVEEEIVALVHAGPFSTSVDEIRATCAAALAEIAEHDTVGFAWTHLRPGRIDLTEPARERAGPMPTALLIGPRAVRGLGADTFTVGALPAPKRVGRPRVPGLLWTLGDDGAVGWEQLADLVTHLRPERIVEVAPALADALGLGSSPTVSTK